MVYKSEDIKKMNSMVLLKELHKLNTATMAELVEITQFSQSSVRSILKDLQSKGILVLNKIDQSTGGRCPSRYTFSQKQFQILSIFIDEGTVEMVLKDIFNHVTLQQHIICELNSRLEDIIVHIVQENLVNCISIASSGVIQDDCFYTDHGDYMLKHEIAIHLKKRLKIPIIIENDVKCMMMGIQAKQHFDNLAYIYMSETGVGSAYYLQRHILKGNQSFSGELGLLPYNHCTINEVIASQPAIDILEDIYIQLLMTIAVTIDPEKIIISGKNLKCLSIEKIKTKMHKCLSLRYQLDIDISNNPLNDGLNGLHYIGILKLFDIYTDYERGNKNG